jgi:CubicO group peptidase (beta-lactamase class C family)
MPTTPEDVGLSGSGLDRARAFVESSVQRGQIAGAVVLASRHDQVAQLACIGLRDIEAGLPMEPDTIFRIASMTKPIVSVGVMMLVEAGKLRLDDPVSRYIPEFADATVFAGVEGGRVRLAPLDRPITIHHLLSHTSGLFGEAPHPTLEPAYDNLGDFRYALPELMRRLAEQPLAHQPGAGWRYGWSHDVLGRVIEIATDLPLDGYLASAIFAPLGMGDSGFYVPPDKIGRLAAVYESAAGVLHRIDTAVTHEITEHVPLLSGGGGCASTVPDYLRFTRMLLRLGELDGVRLLRPDTVAEMTRNHLAAPLFPLEIGGDVADGEGYGLGLGVVVEPSAMSLAGSQGTYTWGGSWNTDFWIDPVTELIGIFMAQLEPRPSLRSLGREYWPLVCQALVD